MARSLPFVICALSLGLYIHLSVYNSLAEVLPAPFYLRDFLNQSQGTTISSLMGLFIALGHLILMRQRDHVDVMVFIEKEWPTVPNLLCCVIGGLMNMALVSGIYMYYN